MVRLCETITTDHLAEWVVDARRRTLDLIGDLSNNQLLGTSLQIVNPLLWEIGHMAWFYERWILRHADGRRPIRPDGDTLYDSMAVAHDTRWDLPLPTRDETLRYMSQVQDHVLELLDESQPRDELAYFVMLSVFHEDMHTEAFTYTRQTLGYGPPSWSGAAAAEEQLAGLDEAIGQAGSPPGDAEIPGGTFMLGASTEEPFVLDNEKWRHAVQVQPFVMARTAVTQGEFLAFVEDAGYTRGEFWSSAGADWREASGAAHPVYWRRTPAGQWQRRDFDRWTALEPNRPMLHTNWHEAEAYCRWAGRRLPTEAEWEVAALAEPTPGGDALSERKRRFPWGDERSTPRHANLDWRRMGTQDVAALPDGDSPWGCRQMIGNVWEWTADTFGPYPGFVADPYEAYSRPWFGTRKVLRGGCWATRERILRGTWRNYYKPDRRDVWAGFRTCEPRE